MSEKADAHTFFNLMVPDYGQLPINIYTEFNITFLGIKVPNVGVLIINDPSQMMTKKHQSKLPGIPAWNLVQLSSTMFVKNYGTSGLNPYMSRGS